MMRGEIRINSIERITGVLNHGIVTTSQLDFWTLVSGSMVLLLIVGLFIQYVSHKGKQNPVKQFGIKTRGFLDQTLRLLMESSKMFTRQESLTELNRTKANFFNSVTHDLRVPLSLIMTILQKYETVAEHKEVNPSLYSDIKLVSSSVHKLNTLVDHLHTLSEIERKEVSLKKSAGDVMLFISQFCKSMETMAEKERIKFHADIGSSFNCLFDPDKLKKILHNLLLSFFKQVKTNGSVKLCVINISTGVIITISDSNNDSEGSNVFPEKYSDDKTYFSSSIELALVKELVNIHGGAISTSMENDSKTCHIFLPFEPIGLHITNAPATLNRVLDIHATVDPLNSTAKIDELSAVLDHDKTKILLVENNDEQREYLKLQLSNSYVVFTADCSSKGIELAHTEQPDLIVMNSFMPGMSGIELCSVLKNNDKTFLIPIIMLTHSSNSKIVVEVINAGADDYFTMPYNLKELKVRISNIIDQRQKFKRYWLNDFGVDLNKFKSRDKGFLEKAIKLVNDNIENARFNVEEMQRQIGMSRMQLHRKLKALTDLSTGDFIRYIRLQTAKKMLEKDNKISVAEVAYGVGFTDPSYFSKVFKKYFKKSPKSI